MVKARTHERDEAGFASILIAMALITILSLLTIGFAELMRANQRQALNKQLSSQAYYAAESGVNDAEKAISAGFVDNKSSCDPYNGSNISTSNATSALAAATYLAHNTVGTSTGSTYPCLLINPAPTSVVMDVGAQTPSIFQMTGVNSTGATTPISELFISWQNVDGSTQFRSANSSSFPPLSTWGDTTGVLRLALTPLQSGQICRNGLESDTYTTFLYPSAGTGVASQNYTSGGYDCTSAAGNIFNASSGTILNGNCNTTPATLSGSLKAANYCTVEISNLSYSDIVMDLRSIYQNTQVSITAYNCASGPCSPLQIKNAQYLIDSTGNAQGQLKRIQVRLPAKNTYAVPDFALQTSADICKQIQIYPNGGTDTCP